MNLKLLSAQQASKENCPLDVPGKKGARRRGIFQITEPGSRGAIHKDIPLTGRLQDIKETQALLPDSHWVDEGESRCMVSSSPARRHSEPGTQTPVGQTPEFRARCET